MKETVIIGHGFNNIDGTMRGKIFSSQAPHVATDHAAPAPAAPKNLAPPPPASGAAAKQPADGNDHAAAAHNAAPAAASAAAAKGAPAAAPLGGAGNPFLLAIVPAPQSAQDKKSSEAGPVKTISALESDIRYQLIDNYESFRKLTEASLGISSNFNNVSANVKGTFSHQIEFNHQDVFYFIRIKTKHHVDVLEQYNYAQSFMEDLARLHNTPVPSAALPAVPAPAVTPHGINPAAVPAINQIAIAAPPVPIPHPADAPPALPDFLNITSADDFYSKYGDEVIDSVVYGSELSILIQFKCRNEDDKRTVKGALGVKTPWVGVDANYAREVEKQLKDIAVFGVYTSKGRKGSTTFSVIQDLKQLNQTVEEFTKSEIDPAQINFTTKPWREILGSNARLKVIADVTTANLNLLKQISSCHDYCKSQVKLLEFQGMQLNNNPDYEKIRNAQLVYSYIINRLVELANKVTAATTSNITYAGFTCAADVTAINADLAALDNYIKGTAVLPPALITNAGIPVVVPPPPGPAPALPVTSSFTIALPPPYVSDLSNCRLLLSFDGRIKSHTLGSSSFDFITQVTKQKQKLAIDLDKLPSSTEYISCQLHPVAGVTLRNDFTIKLKSPNNTTLGIMKSKSVKHAVQIPPARPTDRYVAISMDKANSVVYGDHKQPVELQVEDPVDNSVSEQKKKHHAKRDADKPHQAQNHYLIFKLPKVNDIVSVNPAGAQHDTPLTVSLVAHAKPTV